MDVMEDGFLTLLLNDGAVEENVKLISIPGLKSLKDDWKNGTV